MFQRRAGSGRSTPVAARLAIAWILAALGLAALCPGGHCNVEEADDYRHADVLQQASSRDDRNFLFRPITFGVRSLLEGRASCPCQSLAAVGDVDRSGSALGLAEPVPTWVEVVRYQPGSHDPGRGPARGLRLSRYEARRES